MSDIQESSDNIDDFLSAFGDGKLPKMHLTIEDEFYDKMTSTANGTKVNKLGNIRYYLNSHEIPKFQYLKEKGVALQLEEEINTKPIAGAISQRPQRTKIKRDLTQEEFIKLSIEYYLLMHCLPYFILEDQAPHRQVCNIDIVVSMFMEHTDIKELINKRY